MRFLDLPGPAAMLLMQWVNDGDDDHVEILQQCNLLAAMSPGQVVAVVACPDGPPLVAISIQG